MDPHITDWLTKPSQVLWTDSQPVFQVVYISVFSLYKLSLDFQKYNYISWDLICLDVPKKAKWLQRCMLNIFLKVIYLHSVHPRFCWGVWVFYRIFKKVGLTGSQFLEGGCQSLDNMQEDQTKKREGVFLSGGWYPDEHCDLILLCAGLIIGLADMERVEFWSIFPIV